jgi:hypothetical protein
VTVTFPRSSGLRWPTQVTDHETVLG